MYTRLIYLLEICTCNLIQEQISLVFKIMNAVYHYVKYGIVVEAMAHACIISDILFNPKILHHHHDHHIGLVYCTLQLRYFKIQKPKKKYFTTLSKHVLCPVEYTYYCKHHDMMCVSVISVYISSF